jgi:hypothetical protein
MMAVERRWHLGECPRLPVSMPFDKRLTEDPKMARWQRASRAQIVSEAKRHLIVHQHH